MRTKKSIKELPERLERRKFLFALEEQLDARKEFGFTASDLQSLNIDVQHMSLDETSDSKPKFFTPRPNLPKPTRNDLEIWFEAPSSEDSSEDEDDSTISPGSYAYWVETSLSRYAYNWIDEDPEAIKWRWSYSGNYNSYKPLDNFDMATYLSFSTFKVLDVRGKTFPHVKAVAFDEWLPDEQTITRGELLTILRLMFTQMKQLRLVKHMIAPVFLVSILGKKVRAIESYYDGKHLVLRYTPFYRIPEQDNESTLQSFKAITEWYIGDPIGDTL